MSTLSRWNEEEGEYDEVQVTQKLVEGLRDATLDFAKVLNSYIWRRQKVDQDFKDVPDLDLESGGGSREGASFDVLGDSILIQWQEQDRCGRSAELHKFFPFSDLWTPDSEWEARIRAEVDEKARKEAAVELARKKATEEQERELFQALQAKYGGARPAEAGS